MSDEDDEYAFGDANNDNEAEPQPSAKSNMSLKDIFGDDLSDSDDEPPEPALKKKKTLTKLKQDSDEEVELEDKPSTSYSSSETVVLKTPVHPVPALGSKLYSFRLPNALHLEHRHYNSESFKSEYIELDEDARLNSSHRDSVVRWRKNAQNERDSNSRVVKWSDGSLQLFVGNEVFNITQQDMMNSENVHLFVKADDSLLMCHGKLTDKLTFKPHTLNKTRMQEKISRSAIQAVDRMKRVTKLTQSNKEKLLIDDVFDEKDLRRGKRRPTKKGKVEDVVTSQTTMSDSLLEEQPSRSSKKRSAPKKKRVSERLRRRSRKDSDDDDDDEEEEEEEE
ncbi:hypothetical protein AKO1_007553, partial [Acrasis kona]